jgi:predicted metal-dependent peptidase
VEQEREIAARVFEAHAQEKAAGTGSAGAFRGILADKKGDDIPWGQILSMHMQELLVVDSTFSKPNRRFIGQGIVLPGPQKLPNGCLVFAVDTSGSLGQEELDIICGNVNDIVDAIQPIDVYIVYCDYSINKAVHFEFGDTIVMNAYGGGGTRFAPPFNWVTHEGITPDILVYFTDGCGCVEGEMLDDGVPDYPVIWASTTDYAPTFDKCEEFGELIEIGNIL